MAGALRHIAVTVEEAEAGEFEWVLLEQGIDWAPLKRAKRPTGSYAKAMAAGLLALQDMIEDLGVGPREEKLEAGPAQRAQFGFGFGGLK
jgi:hypothetical protein